MHTRHMSGISIAKLVIIVIGTILLAAVGWLLYDKFFSHSNGPIPASIASTLEFTPLVISHDAVDYKQTSFKYGSVDGGDDKVLSFIVTQPNGNTITASEYPQPPQFNEVQDFKSKFLENKSEDTVVSDNGTIYLSHPEKQKNTQIGLMLEKGLIVFFNPTKNLSKSEWRDLGNSLTTQRTK